jgi:hypothetical protein
MSLEISVLLGPIVDLYFVSGVLNSTAEMLENFLHSYVDKSYSISLN